VTMLSERLQRTLRAYCNQMDLSGIDDLRTVVSNGTHAWFPDEFRAAIVGGEITPALWEQLTDSPVDEEDEPELLYRDLREVWAAVTPGEPFPLDTAPQ
jgi:hypothetical protein